ncbi:hypothetical protein AVEN_179294-1 [Araneus ventricosus]|uniref:Uncharacterized protein n=1 Tax=Araneus ventricosus TaxID=182803 RepID=A0A4Y2LAB1_ARAVE|nr:hypothetical protein AVEN_179294-1 [Araneus ventricosus]
MPSIAGISNLLFAGTKGDTMGCLSLTSCLTVNGFAVPPGGEKNKCQNARLLKVSGMDKELSCDFSAGRCHPVGSQIFETHHNLSNPRVKATVKLIGDRFFWSFYKKEVSWCPECL